MSKLNTYIYFVCECGDIVYFFDTKFHSLWKTNKELSEIRFVKKLDKGLLKEKFVPFEMFNYKEHLYICSHSSASIIEYNLEKKNFLECYSSKGKEMTCEYNNLFWHGQIYSFPFDLNREIYSFDLSTKTCRNKMIIDFCESDKTAAYIFQNNNEVFFAEREGYNVYKLDLNNNQTMQYKFNEKLYGNVCCVGEKIYALSYDEKKLLRYSDNQIERIQLSNSEAKNAYGALYVVGDSIFIIPKNNKQLIVYNTKSELFEVHSISLKEGENVSEASSLLFAYATNSQGVIFLPYLLKDALFYDQKDKQLKRIELNYIPHREMLDGQEMVSEVDVSLDDFCKNVLLS